MLAFISFRTTGFQEVWTRPDLITDIVSYDGHYVVMANGIKYNVDKANKNSIIKALRMCGLSVEDTSLYPTSID